MEKPYTSTMAANEMVSLLFRQRGVPSVDVFTSQIISEVRQAFCFVKVVYDTLSRMLVRARWLVGWLELVFVQRTSV
jgi:hypothetical protein